MATNGEQKLIVRIESAGRVSIQVVSGSRKAMEVAAMYNGRDASQRITVLDAAGRVVWKS